MIALGLNQLASNVFKTLSRQVFAGLLQLVTVVVIARICGPEGSGIYNVTLLLPTLLAALLNLGIAPANVYHLGAGRVSLQTAWLTTCRIWCSLSLVGIALGVVAIFWFSSDWFPGVDVFLLWVSLASFPVILLLNFLCSLFQGVQRFTQFNLIVLLQPLLTLLFVLPLLRGGNGGVDWLLMAYLFASLITLLVGMKLLNALLPGCDKAISNNYGQILLRYGYKSHLSNMLTVINYKADILLVNYFLGPVAVGIYVIAVQLVERLWIFSQSVSTVILPRLSELAGDEDKRRHLTPMISRWVLWVTFGMAILLGAISYPLISLLFGPEFRGGVLPLWFLLPGIVVMAPARVLANDIAARGRPGLNMYSTCAALVVNISGNVILIPQYGLAGAAISTSAAYGVIFVLCLLMHYHFTGVPMLKNILLCREDIDAVKAYIASRS